MQYDVIEVKMTETLELNRPVICDDRIHQPHPALLTLSTAHRGCAQIVHCSHSRFIFLIGYNGVGSIVHDKILLKRALRLTTISSAASVIWDLVNFTIAVDSLRPALLLLRGSWPEEVTQQPASCMSPPRFSRQ